MSELVIRPAEQRDVPAIGQLLYQIHKVHSDARPDLFTPGARKMGEEDVSALLREDGVLFWVAELDGKVAGHAYCVLKQVRNRSSAPDQTVLYLEDFCVDETCRGQHIGTELFDFLKGYAAAHNCDRLELNVYADNTSAVRFYEHMGLRPQKLGMEFLLCDKNVGG